MPIRVALHHTTEYRYDRNVSLQPHVVRLRPAPHCRTPVVAYSLQIEPKPHFLNWQQDPYNNYLARLVFLQPADHLRVVVDLIAELTTINPFDFFVEPAAERYPFTYDAVLARELTAYLETEPVGPLLADLVARQRRAEVRTVDYVVGLNRHLQQALRYVIRMEPGIQGTEETLAKASGSCRDSAWLLVQLLRHLGLAARFVSGYLIQLKADVKPVSGPPGPDTDFTDLHAWAEVYLPGAGWVGLDPTSGLVAGEGHLPLACSADPITAAPISGSYSWDRLPGEEKEARCQESFDFHLTVTRLRETPRVTRPYTDEQWQAIHALGEQIDDRLRAGDVRLTLGGEPTFVAQEDRDAPEWNTAALGPAKRRMAGTLLRRLRDRWAPGALLHFGQGKWYPGESLPRWALGCYWRRDGEPIWRDPALIADDTRHLGHHELHAREFAQVLAGKLGVDPGLPIPAYEDAWYYLWRERRLPANVDPFDSKLEEPEERARLAQVFGQGLAQVVGYALPLRREESRWVSGPWPLRRERLYLIPGDSPMGYRLPLDSLPWEAPEQAITVIDPDPMAPPKLLPTRQEMQRPGQASKPLSRQPLGGSGPDALTGVVRTTLCVEPRAGRLHIFMPPQRSAADYLELVTAVEATAAELDLPVLIDGYTPPFDPELAHFQITPDPGVVEVNIHPSTCWSELVERTETLYEEARQVGLTTEKFLLDGRPTGTGGGNHVVIGGPTPADSPLLRRPDLLRSLVGYWHNHPVLSYLFSSQFIGPTSQAPRVDEARNDSLYELELAFRQIPGSGPLLPWLVDRVFRHALVDVTGNTHRAEFCIDKLYSPDTAAGRRGLLELRAFEMPPHPHMSLVQQLLLRALIARFWAEPEHRHLARWGTELHDRFLLPHFLAQDLGDVIEDLSQAGFSFKEDWFAAHKEFRFPAIGSVAYRGIHLELRCAAEPWHVLGEEPGAGGTARYVDSSVERLQVKVNGLTDGRHLVTCNGRRVPLYPTGANGEFVAGVRFRSWQPPSCLHPTIPVHAPLVFDILDTWQGRSIGGCTYHVSHPGGLAHDTQPVNASEAESRRVARFFSFGHTPGSLEVPPLERFAECPLTLDLRQPPGRSDQPAVTFTPASTGDDTMRNRVIMNGSANVDLPSKAESVSRR